MFQTTNQSWFRTQVPGVEKKDPENENGLRSKILDLPFQMV
jgi:hypothetical protein